MNTLTEIEIKTLEAISFLSSQYELKPEVGIILGTGLNNLIEEVKIEFEVSYKEVPHFGESTLQFHKGKLVYGKIGGKYAIIMQGRFHFYEGFTMKEVTFPVRVLKQLGIKVLLISNAAGGLNSSFKKSDLMIINDHINLFPENPLVGKNADTQGDRFPDMSEPYDLTLIEVAKNIAKKKEIKIKEGVYVGVSGPNLETKAEYNFLRIIGADAVGMSTIPEVIVARHLSLPVFATSVITDLCYPGVIEKVDISKIIEAAANAEPSLTSLFCGLVEEI